MARPRQKPLYLYDLTYLYDYDMSDPAQAASAYDQMLFVATLQGLVNRRLPLLYVRFITRDEFGSFDVDGYWLDLLRREGEMLSSKQVKQVRDLNELLRLFRRHVRGTVVWDPRVPATSNVATTVAGAEDLVAIRYDPSEGSLYSRYVAVPEGDPASLHLPTKVSLVRPDGSSLFTGSGKIPGTSVPSTGSAKCDAYLWAKIRYLDAGRCDPSELAFYLDAYWLAQPQIGLQQSLLLNRDYMVSKRGFVFDLSPWDDEAPIDDPDQPLGTDLRTLQSILLSAYRKTGGKMLAIHGFVPWAFKYTSFGQAGGKHEPVASEWRFVQVASAYNAYLDADAEGLDGMANASVFAHNPTADFYAQNPKPTVDDFRARGFVLPDGGVAPRRYVMFYVGDYDSAAWLYHVVPRLWHDPNRGAVPLNWAFNPNLSQRMSPALVYTRSTRTPNDFFIAGDSGAGYLNPGMLQEPREFSGLPSGISAWREHCEPYFRRWDLSVTGFIIDGFAPGLNAEGKRAYSQFSPDGFAAQKIEPVGMVDNTPYIRMGIDLPRASSDEAAAALESSLEGDTSRPPFAPEFHCFRTILQSPTWHKEVVDRTYADLPNAAVEFVDAYTFYGLLKLYLQEVIIRPIKTTLSPGRTMPVVLDATTYAPRQMDVTLSLEVPYGWTASSSQISFTLNTGETRRLSMSISVPEEADLGTYTLTARLQYDGASRERGLQVTVVRQSYADADEVYVVLGETNQAHGIVQIEQEDGQTTVGIVGGRQCRKPLFTRWEYSYIYLQVDDTFMFDERDLIAYATVEYYDASGQSFGIHYDSNDPTGTLNGAYTDAGTVTTTGSNEWRTHTFELANVRFANRQNGGSDLRIYTRDEVCFSKISISRSRA